MSSLSGLDPALLQQYATTNPKLMEQYRQNQQETGAEQPNQQTSSPAAPPKPAPIPRRPFRPSISGGRLVHSRPFAHLGRKK